MIGTLLDGLHERGTTRADARRGHRRSRREPRRARRADARRLRLRRDDAGAGRSSGRAAACRPPRPTRSCALIDRRADRARSARVDCAAGIRGTLRCSPPLPARADDPPAAYIEAMDANLTRNWAPLTGVVTPAVQADRSADPGAVRPARRTRARRRISLRAMPSARARSKRCCARATTAFASRGSAAENTTLELGRASAAAGARLRGVARRARRAHVHRTRTIRRR